MSRYKYSCLSDVKKKEPTHWIYIVHTHIYCLCNNYLGYKIHDPRWIVRWIVFKDDLSGKRAT